MLMEFVQPCLWAMEKIQLLIGKKGAKNWKFYVTSIEVIMARLM